jgi:chromosomal replication initiator protein
VSGKVFKQQLRDLLLENFSGKELEQWYDPLSLEKLDEKTVRILFPHQLFMDWFNSKFKKKFEEKISGLHCPDFIPLYNIRANEQKYFPKNKKFENLPAEEDKTRLQTKDFCAANIFSNNFSFETFICNKKNQLPLSAAKSFAKLESPSPFTLHAHTGRGKTHLLHSIYQKLTTFVSKKHIFFGKLTKLETIINNNTKPGSPPYIPFFEKRIFIIDNFQECIGKDDLQKKFIALIEFCLEQNIHLIISIDSPPNAWGFMRAKLRSMLESGLIIEIKKPDLEVKIQYIQTQNDLLDLKLKKGDILNIARLYSEFRQIQGILLKILAFKTHDAKYSGVNLEQLIKNTGIYSQNSISPEFIIEQVAEYIGIKSEDIKSNQRAKNIVLARHIGMYLLRDILMLNFDLIGEFMDRDHSSVLYSVNKIKELLITNKETHRDVTTIKNLCLTKSKLSGLVP